MGRRTLRSVRFTDAEYAAFLAVHHRLMHASYSDTLRWLLHDADNLADRVVAALATEQRWLDLADVTARHLGSCVGAVRRVDANCAQLRTVRSWPQIDEVSTVTASMLSVLDRASAVRHDVLARHRPQRIVQRSRSRPHVVAGRLADADEALLDRWRARLGGATVSAVFQRLVAGTMPEHVMDDDELSAIRVMARDIEWSRKHVDQAGRVVYECLMLPRGHHPVRPEILELAADDLRATLDPMTVSLDRCVQHVGRGQEVA